MHVLMFGVGENPQTFVRNQIRFLQESGAKVSIWEGNSPPRLVEKAIATVETRYGWTPDLLGKRRALLRAADVYHFQWPHNLSRYVRVIRPFNKPAVLSLRGRAINIVPYIPGYESFARALRQTLPMCSGYHCVSKAILREGALFGLVPERARVIYTALDLSFFTLAENPPAPEPLQIVMIGALSWYKGYEYAVCALERLVKEHGLNARLVIIGEGEDRDRIRYTAADLGVTDRVILTGKLPPDGVRRLLHESHILLHTALSEGIANAVVEGMACGLPVVTARSGGMDEAVSDGVEGFVTPPRDVRAMAAALARLAGDPALRRQLGLAGRERALKQFAPDRQAAEFIDLYRFAIQNHARKA